MKITMAPFCGGYAFLHRTSESVRQDLNVRQNPCRETSEAMRGCENDNKGQNSDWTRKNLLKGWRRGKDCEGIPELLRHAQLLKEEEEEGAAVSDGEEGQ